MNIDLGHDKFAIIDDEDAPVVLRDKWRASKDGAVHYYTYEGRCYTLLLHNHLMLPGPDHYVVFLNGDKFDCRRANMVVTTKGATVQRQAKKPGTSSRFKGVRLYRGKWRAYIKVNGKSISLGTHLSEEEAARAYNRAATYYHGPAARLNEVE